MSGVFGYSREAVRVKVKKCEGSQPPEFRKFSVDPQITSFEVLQSILAKAFDLKGDFTICYRVYDVSGHETYMPLLSDWDLDAAFLKAYNTSMASSSEPCLCLRVDLKPFEECSDDWELRQNVPIITQIRTATCQEAKPPAPRLHGIFNQVGKTLNMVQRAFNFGEDGGPSSLQPPRQALSDGEFRNFLDPVGQIVYAKELRSVIYFGGIDPSLRKVVWKHLLNVYPDGMTGRGRMDYIKKKAAEYVSLRECWKTAIAQGPVVGELAYTTGMVRKDVLRTDRHHPFYAGSDDNQNIASLFNILTTYALNHPKVSYCQGMSDLASPLLVTMNDEAHAYICFTALMQRLCTNFMIDGIAMTQKFTHLAEGLMFYDPEFYNYLKSHQADDLLFCYRWLLLEMKREFAFEDSLRMLEVLWSSLPADPPDKELRLFDVQFQPQVAAATPPISPLVKTPRESAYTKVCALRRQSSSISLSNYTGTKKPTAIVKRQNHSLDETIGRCKSIIIDAKAKHQSLDDASLTRQKLQAQVTGGTTGTTTTNSSSDTSPKASELSPRSPKSESLRPRSVSPLEAKSDSVVLNNRINSHKGGVVGKSNSLSSSMTNLIRSTKKTGHFKELKDRIAAAKLFSSLDRLDGKTQAMIREENEATVNQQQPTHHNHNNHQGKMVKNLNEFLNFASTRVKLSDRLVRNGSDAFNTANPKIMLTKSSFDGNDSETSSTRHSASSTNDDDDDGNDDTFDEYSPDDSQEYFPLTTSVTRELRLELENLDRKVFGDKYIERLSESDCSSNSDLNKTQVDEEDDDGDDDEEDDDDEEKIMEEGQEHAAEAELLIDNKKRSNKSDDVFIWENPLHTTTTAAAAATSPNIKSLQTPDEQADIEYDDNDIPTVVNETLKTVTPIKILTNNAKVKSKVRSEDAEKKDAVLPPSAALLNGAATNHMTNSCEEVTESAVKSTAALSSSSSSLMLPPPNEFGGGNPFLMFLCITVLLQHRDHIITLGMDYNEMAMHFDKMVRKHNVTRVLNQARQMYARYIKQHTIAQQKCENAKQHEDC